MIKLDTSSDTVLDHPSYEFLEVQKVRRVWMWLLFIVAYTGLGAMAAHNVFYKKAVGQSLLSFSSIIFVAALLLVVGLLIYKSRLVTSIGQEGIWYRFSPLQVRNRFIAWSELEEVRVRQYDAISEYGGWGIKFGSEGKAYTVKGRYGLQLEATDGRKILIGTQRPIELERLILSLVYDYKIH